MGIRYDERMETDLLSEIYKSAKLSTDTIVHMIGRVSNAPLRSDLSTVLSSYEKIAAEAAHMMQRRGETAQRPSLRETLPTRTGVFLNTLFGAPPERVARMISDASAIGASRMRQLLGGLENAVGQDVRALSEQMIAAEEENRRKMTPYLGSSS